LVYLQERWNELIPIIAYSKFNLSAVNVFDNPRVYAKYSGNYFQFPLLRFITSWITVFNR
jgi:hypothetical protein